MEQEARRIRRNESKGWNGDARRAVITNRQWIEVDLTVLIEQGPKTSWHRHRPRGANFQDAKVDIATGLDGSAPAEMIGSFRQRDGTLPRDLEWYRPR